MEQLEIRYYTRAELVELFGEPDKNFARTVKDTLTKWGYKIDNYSRKGVDIIAVPATAQEQLKEIMLRKFNLDVRADIYAFACFVSLLLEYEDFASMPWNQRVAEMKECYGITISKEALEKWGNKLIKQDIINKSIQTKSNWRTRRNAATGERVRELVDGDPVLEQEMQQYKDRRKELYKKMSWNEASKLLWKEFECYYYTCGTLTLNAIGEDMHKVYELIKKIESED